MGGMGKRRSGERPKGGRVKAHVGNDLAAVAAAAAVAAVAIVVVL